MQNNIDDKQFKKLFEALKQEDGQTTPDFDKMWETALAQKKAPQTTLKQKWFGRATIAAAVSIGLIGTWISFQTTSSSKYTESSNLDLAAVYEWQAMSDALLSDEIFYAHELSYTDDEASLFSWEAPSDALLASPTIETSPSPKQTDNQLDKIELN